MDFNTWLQNRSGHTAGELYALACATGSPADYDKLMAWYKDRYILEIDNPFKRKGDNEHE